MATTTEPAGLNTAQSSSPPLLSIRNVAKSFGRTAVLRDISLQVAEGSEDEFVHIENTLTLEDQLLDAGKYSDVLLLADRGHTLIDPQARLVLFQRLHTI